MVLIASKITALFEDADQMELSNRTRFDSLNAEGITLVYDLAELEDDDWNQCMSNRKKPDRIPDPINTDQLIHQFNFPLSVNYLKRLEIASRIVCYYDSVSFDMMAANLRWTVLDNSEIQHKAMGKKAKQSISDVPKHGANTTVDKWNNSITVHAIQVFEARKSTIEYFLQDNAAVVAPHPPLLVNQPHSDVGGSVQEEQGIRLYHMHPLYRDNNKQF